jgi:hypothetical protein
MERDCPSHHRPWVGSECTHSNGPLEISPNVTAHPAQLAIEEAQPRVVSVAAAKNVVTDKISTATPSTMMTTICQSIFSTPLSMRPPGNTSIFIEGGRCCWDPRGYPVRIGIHRSA